MLYGKNVVAALDAGHKLQMHVGADLCRLVQHLDLIQHLFAAFRALDGFFPVKGAQLCDHFLLMLDLCLLV